MSVSDELLMQYADDELDPATRAEVERAVAGDATLTARVAELRSQRDRLRLAYAPMLEEPVPARLLNGLHAATPRGDAAVVDLVTRRRPVAQRLKSWTWPEWTAIAASLLLGALVMQIQSVRNDDVPFRMRPDGLVAGRSLARALSTQLASSQDADAPVQVGLTFGNGAGRLCRTFSARATRPWSGLACFDDGDWHLGMAIESGPPRGPASSGAMRTAASEIPPEILRAAAEQMRGEPLDAAAERAARDRGWRP